MQEYSPPTGPSPFKGWIRSSRASLSNPDLPVISTRNFKGLRSFAAGNASEPLENHEGFLRSPSCSSQKGKQQNGSH